MKWSRSGKKWQRMYLWWKEVLLYVMEVEGSDVRCNGDGVEW